MYLLRRASWVFEKAHKGCKQRHENGKSEIISLVGEAGSISANAVGPGVEQQWGEKRVYSAYTHCRL